MYKTSLELVVKLSDADRERAMRDDDNNNNDTIGSVRHRVSHRCDQQMGERNYCGIYHLSTSPYPLLVARCIARGPACM
jgi:hypothetical protein